jgi:tetratricopeptide (TPR) repeat protein
MNRNYRFILYLFFVFVVNLTIFTSHSLALPIAQESNNNSFRLGVEKMQSNEFTEAIKEFTEAIENDINPDAAYSNRCLAFLQINQYRDAVADCTKAINFSPGNAEAYLNRGLAQYRLKNYAAAIVDNNKVLALKKNDFRAYYNRGVATAASGNYPRAILDYNQALTLIPQTSSMLVADVYNDRGLAYFKAADLDAAMSDFSRAVRLNDKDDRAYFNRGCTCAKKGDTFSAINDFSQVIRLNPSNGRAYINRAIAYHQLGYQPAAINDLHKAADYFAKSGQKPAYQYTLNILKSLKQQIISSTEIAFLENGKKFLY